MTSKHLVLWDGGCGFCRRCVNFLRSHDRFGGLEFCPFQEADLTPELRDACSRAMHVIKTDGDILKGGRAALFCARFTRWHQLARVGEWPVFLPFVELGYKVVAANRSLLSKWLFRGAR